MRRRRLAALFPARAREEKESNRCPRRGADFGGISHAHPPPLSRPRPIGPQKESPQSKDGCRPRKLRVHPSFHCELVE
jgi:hypothetical protein